MRISLLLQREPFGQILADTLADYWGKLHGEPHLVSWDVRRPSQSDGCSYLIANNYLNAIFHPKLEPVALDPIRREFARSTVPWRRPLQALYVHMATRPTTAPLFAHALIRVSPAVAEIEQLLIIPGNQKIRILDHVCQTSTCLLKKGFDPANFRKEIDARIQAEAVGIRVPRLISHDPEEGVFVEEYVSATPLNRVASESDRQGIREEAIESIKCLVAATQRMAPTDEVVSQLVDQVERASNPSNPNNPMVSDDLRKTVHRLQLEAQSGPVQEVAISMTHGDFQPANILARDGHHWLIDWENAGWRLSCYDPLVLISASRSPVGLASRLNELCENHARGGALENWPNLDWSHQAGRKQLIAMYLLEEILSKLVDSANPLFLPSPHTESPLFQEAGRWVNEQVER